MKGLDRILKEWLKFRTDTVRRRLEYPPGAGAQALHILEGYLVAFLNIDEVIHIIRTEDKPKPALMERFGITDVQAEAILELKLRNLAKLEEMKIRGEQDELAAERDQLQKICSAVEARLKTLIKKELLAVAEKYGDERRSPTAGRSARRPGVQRAGADDRRPITVVMSEKGWIRAAKGHDIDPASAELQVRRWLQDVRARTQQPAHRHPRFHRPGLHRGLPQPALRQGAGRAGYWPHQPALRGHFRGADDG